MQHLPFGLQAFNSVASMTCTIRRPMPEVFCERATKEEESPVKFFSEPAGNAQRTRSSLDDLTLPCGPCHGAGPGRPASGCSAFAQAVSLLGRLVRAPCLSASYPALRMHTAHLDPHLCPLRARYPQLLRVPQLPLQERLLQSLCLCSLVVTLCCLAMVIVIK